MHTDPGVSTAIEARALIHITTCFVLESGAVVDLVTPDEHGQTGADPRAAEVGFWADVRVMARWQRPHCERPCPREVYNDGGWGIAPNPRGGQATVPLVCAVQTVLYPVTAERLRNTLQHATGTDR